jgi:Fic family protein
MNDLALHAFITESNKIEGIHRAPIRLELALSRHFLSLKEILLGDVQNIVDVFQPGARIRDRFGMDVRVGEYIPPEGSWKIPEKLQAILTKANLNRHAFGAYTTHHEFESLHPFSDGNGRSGRLLWLWQMRSKAPLGFLHTFYYQSLQYSR